ncbi:hypothetical protein EDB81DRAFT_908765 [Dactylonectria macrodidyma]|uniref:Uncharacterized protein n=1 Tax=Dactylonectria macrodidyma TaxID=307937 RepID=A0A9P9FPG2_9HYPO|nr:hypothetical protein EDB81DRAFT_908765 [Dactylonectria macrodidyma]
MCKTKENWGKYILMKILSKPSPNLTGIAVEDTPARETPTKDLDFEDSPAEDMPARESPVEDSHATVSHVEDSRAEDMQTENALAENTPEESMAAEASSPAALTPRLTSRAREPRGGELGRSSIDSARRRRGRLQGCVLPVRLPRDFTIGHFLVEVGIAAAGVGVIFLDAGQDCAQAQTQVRDSKEKEAEDEKEAPEVPLIVITPPADTKRTFEWWFGPADIALRMSARK